VNLSTAFPGREAKTGMSILSIKSIKPTVAAVSIVCGKVWIEAQANLYRFKNCKWPERAETGRNAFGAGLEDLNCNLERKIRE